MSLTSGEEKLRGRKVGNLVGLQAPHAFQLGNIGAKIDTGTIGLDTIVIMENLFITPNVIAEFNKFRFNPSSASGSTQKFLKKSKYNLD